MKFYLQQGYGMMALNEECAQANENCGFILSPRSLNKRQSIDRISEHAKKLQKKGSEVLFDPQFYQPRTNLEKITQFPYFDDSAFLTQDFVGDGAKKMALSAIKYQELDLNVDSYIIPGIYTNSIDEDWLEIFDNLLVGSLSSSYNKKEYYQTISLGPDAVLSPNFDDFIGQCVLSPVNGFYVVLKEPEDNYLIQDSLYLYRLLDAFLSLKLANKKVILGYANQQDLMFAGAGIDGLATGNYQNVRKFDPSIFIDSNEEDIKRKGKWYFDGKTLSEYKLQQLDLAFSRGLKDKFGPINDFNKILFEVDRPSTIAIKWTEKLSFRNYFQYMEDMCRLIEKKEKNERMNMMYEFFKEIESHVNNLASAGFRHGTKGFSSEAFEATLDSMSSILSDREFDIKQL